VEFYEAVRTHMDGDGMYAMNLIDYPPAGFARAEAATLGDVFEHVMVVAPADYLYGDRGGNYVLVASDRPFDAAAMESRMRRRGAEELVLVGDALDEWVDGARPLTDDFAPVDQLITRDG